MKTFTVHHYSDTPDGILLDPDNAVFVKEGMAWAALYQNAFWALRRKMWIVACLIVAIDIALYLGIQALHLPPGAGLVIFALFNLLIALEGNDLRRWTLERRGLELVGIVTGATESDCEQIFFERVISEAEQPVRPRPAPASGFRLPDTPDDSLLQIGGGSR